MYKIIAFAILFFFFLEGFGFPLKGDPKNAGVRVVDLDASEKKNLLAECKDLIKVLPLETTDQCVIGTINHIRICEPYVFIFDHNRDLFVYKLDGKFVFKIESRGQETDGVSHVTGFYVDASKKEVVIYDHTKGQLFHYDFQGKQLKVARRSVPLLEKVDAIDLLPDNKMLLTLNYAPGLNHSFATLRSNDCSLDRFHLSYPFTWKEYVDDMSNSKPAQNSDGTYVIPMLSDTVYQYRKGGFVPVWAFKSRLKPANYAEIDTSRVKDYYGVWEQACNNKEMSQGCRGILMTDSTGYTACPYNEGVEEVFWNLHTGKSCILRIPDGYSGIFNAVSPQTTFREYFVGNIQAFGHDWEAIIKECTPEVANQLRNVKEEDNPILVFYPITIK